MKYGEALEQRSVPEWAPYNVDYNELKHLIKVNTSRDQGQAITIPGHDDSALQKFENTFFAELWNQHDRVDLFVKSKADEYSRRLRDCQKKAINLIARTNFDNRRGISAKRREKFARLENRILSCGDDIRSLEKFIDAQRIAFGKILKKYRKWTGSTTLGIRFTDEVLSSPKSFTRFDFGPLNNQYNVVVSLLRDATPPQSEVNTPLVQSRQDFRQEAPREPVAFQTQQQQHYWNEYDDGSEAGDMNEPYTIYIDADANSSFPGAKILATIFSRLNLSAKVPIQRVKMWLSPSSSPDEQRPLMSERQGGYFAPQHNSNFVTETDIDDDASSSDFPNGYEAHYATFPSVSDQKLSLHREQLLFRGTVASFAAAFLLLLIAGLLVSTGRRRLRVEVDAGVIIGVVASLFFATLGFTTMLYRWTRLGLLHISCVTASFLVDCVFSGILLVLVMGNTKL